MDWLYKALLTGMTVAAALMVARLIGRRAAGLLAGLPVITVPALLWVAHEQGVDFAVHSAVGSAAACAMAPWFAASFLLLAQRFRAATSLAGALLAAWVMVSLLQGLEGRPGLALVTALASGLLVLGWLGRQQNPIRPSGRRSGAQTAYDPAHGPTAVARELGVTAALAGIVSACVSLLATTVGPYWTGVLSTLPLISACTLVHLQRTCGSSALPGFVSGYVVGVLAKAVFVCAFAWMAPHWGATPALVMAIGVGVAAAAAVSGRHRSGPDTHTVVAARAVRP